MFWQKKITKRNVLFWQDNTKGMFCSDKRQKTFLWYYLLWEQNILLVLSSVRTEHSFGIIFCQNRIFLWYCLLSEQNIPLDNYQRNVLFWQKTTPKECSVLTEEHTKGMLCSDRRQSPKECSVLPRQYQRKVPEHNIPLILSSVRTEHSFDIVFCQNRTFLWYYLLSEQNILLVLSSVRTEHSFGIVFCQNRRLFGDCLLSEQNIPLVLHQRNVLFWQKNIPKECYFLREDNHQRNALFWQKTSIVFCQNRRLFGDCLLSEQNIPLVLSSVRTEHSFGDCLLSEQNIHLVIVFCQNRTFLWWLSFVRTEHWQYQRNVLFWQKIIPKECSVLAQDNHQRHVLF
jgi:hypothetical protein